MDPAEIVPARDGEEFAVRVNGGDWIVAWHPASMAPKGTPHGATAICLTADGGLVLIGNDGERWGLPGGRPERQESWEQTLHREVLEEACAKVVRARLLGFTQGKCGAGPEEGLVLVRSLWRAEVELAPWTPQFEIAHRRVIPAEAWPAHLWIDDGFAAIFWRAFAEAGLSCQHLEGGT
jgi:ADP-ribose pyrophosphatase YjhB (NUDIX family)